MMRLRAALSVFGSVFLLALLGVSDPILQMINASPDIYSVYSLRSSQVLSVIGLLCVGIPAALGLLALLHRYVRDALTLVLVSLVLMSALHDLCVDWRMAGRYRQSSGWRRHSVADPD